MWKTNLIWIDGRAFASHVLWECVKHGLYKETGHQGHKKMAVDILMHLDSLAVMALNCCPISAAVHLTNKAINCKAYIGQLSCCVLSDCAISVTTEAWWSLSPCQQKEANQKAIEAAEQWLHMNLRQEIYQAQSGQLGFQF